VKQKYWQQGFACQADASYFAMKILQTYPQIADALVQRFPEFVLDEAQDTNDVQMRIIEILCEHGLKEILLIGDPDQAIFEWNNAKPQLFKSKYLEWEQNSMQLNDNRRSSQFLCNATYGLSTLQKAANAVNPEVKDRTILPQVVVYDEQNLQLTIDWFLVRCQEENICISPNSVAVLCRSKSFIAHLSGGHKTEKEEPWTNDIVTYSLTLAAYYYQNRKVKEAFKVLTRAFCMIRTGKNYVSGSDIETYVEEKGWTALRTKMLKFLDAIPSISTPLGQWIENVNNYLMSKQSKLRLQINQGHETADIQHLFGLDHRKVATAQYTIGTVHSVKGETYEAVLLFLKTGGIGKKYKTLLNNSTLLDESEELRIVYVGITRPRLLLAVAVPDEINKAVWEQKFLPYESGRSS
jgi:DNA helicase II / ATP-dependent DNA helicase PcrA